MNSREAFEAWWKTHNIGTCITDKDDAWEGWQASRKQLLKELSDETHAVAECFDDGSAEGGIKWIPYCGVKQKIEVGTQFIIRPTGEE